MDSSEILHGTAVSLIKNLYFQECKVQGEKCQQNLRHPTSLVKLEPAKLEIHMISLEPAKLEIHMISLHQC